MKLSNYRNEITLTKSMFYSVPADMFHMRRTHILRSHVLADQDNPFIFFCQVFFKDMAR